MGLESHIEKYHWKKNLTVNQGRIHRGFVTSQPVSDPKLLSQSNKKPKILK